MPMKKALELCPEAVLQPVNMRRYKEVSKQVMTIFERFTPDIEPVSIDEAYLGVKKGTGLKTAQQIRAAVKKELKLPISVGISVNKLLAKIACDLAKPDNIKAIWPEDVPDTIWSLPVKTIPGIGSSTEKKCYLYGIKTVGDLAKFPDKALISAFGKNGVIFKNYANGYDNRELELIHKTKSISEETTFPQDVFDREQVLTTLLALSEEVGYRLRSKKFRAKTISLKLRFADFTTISRDITLQEPIDKDLQIYRLVERLFLRYSNKPPWRLVGVKVSGLEKNQQLSLLSSAAENENKIMLVKDRLRDKYGQEVLVSAKRLLKHKRIKGTTL